MGRSYGEFVKYPRTPHLFGSKGTDDDKHLGEPESRRFIADEFLIVEEKLGALIGPSRFDSVFENPVTNRIDHLMEGLYLRTEQDGAVIGRAKFEGHRCTVALMSGLRLQCHQYPA